MTTINVYGKVQKELASEFATLAGCRIEINGITARFDTDNLADLELIARDAARYLGRISKKARAKAADSLREAFAEIRISEEYALKFAK
jgi:hypothetical protein